MALIVIDMQYDFMDESLEGKGALPVNGARAIETNVFGLVETFPISQGVATKDAHPEDHCSFKENGGQWPRHCVRGTKGAEIVWNLTYNGSEDDYYAFVWLKGGDKDVDAYGGFWDIEGNRSGLTEQLRWRGFKTLVLCGLAFDFCVGETAKQGVEDGFEVYIVEDATRAVFPDEYEKKKEELIAAGVKFIQSDEFEAA